MADAPVVLTAVHVPSQARTGHTFYVGFGIAVILLSFAGFAPSLIDHSRRYAPPMTLHMVHGATALAWLLLYVTQALRATEPSAARHYAVIALPCRWSRIRQSFSSGNSEGNWSCCNELA